MLDHISIGVTDLNRSIAFYDAVLEPLGYKRLWSDDDAAGYGVNGKDDAFAIKKDLSKQASCGTRFHIAFSALTRTAVERFYEVAVGLGAIADDSPQLHPVYGDGYFAAFVLDPDEYRIEAVCHE